MQTEIIATLINLMDKGWSGDINDLNTAKGIRESLTNLNKPIETAPVEKDLFSQNERRQMDRRLSHVRGDRGVSIEPGFKVQKGKSMLKAVGDINRLSRLTIFTDGSHRPNNKASGSAYVYCKGKTGDYRNYGMDDVVQYGTKRINGGDSYIAELTAIVEALKHLPDKIKKVTIVSDSLSVVDRINDGSLKAWGDSNFVQMKKHFNNGTDLWKYIYKRNKELDVRYDWVKGHHQTRINVFADKLAGITSNA